MNAVTLKIENILCSITEDGEVYPQEWKLPITGPCATEDQAIAEASAYILANPEQF